jgi:beta-galactosidase
VQMTGFLPFGAQYYRAPTPKPDAWARDLANIRRHGFNTIKIWAQWRWNNPREGEFDFSDLVALMDLAAQNDLKVVINAIYDVAPAWFWRKYPDSVMVCNSGRRIEPQTSGCRQIGGVPGPSYHHPEGIEIRRTFTEALAKTFAGHAALYIWDLWNEPELTAFTAREPRLDDLADYSAYAQRAFVEWLKTRYAAIENLNARWNRNYQCWDEVETPRNPHCFNDMIDWRLFFVDTLTAELDMRIQALRRYDKTTPVMVHTVPIPYFNVVTCASDEYRLAALCDLFGNSVGSHPFAAAVTTSAAPGKTVINAEIHARYGSIYNSPPVLSLEDMKRHILVPLARGVKGFLFWQYRPETLGTESPAWGLTDLDGGETPWLRHAIRINEALQRLAPSISGAATIAADVAVINGTKNQVFDWCAGGDIDRHYKSVLGVFMALYRHNYNVDVVSTENLLDHALATYRVIYYPFPYYVEDAVAERLREYVEGGGTLIAEAFFAGIKESDGLHALRMPGLGFDQVFGVRQGVTTSGAAAFNQYADLAGAARTEHDMLPLALDADLPGISKGSRAWGYRFAEELVPGTAQVLGHFDGGRVALTSASYGKGQAIMAGTLLGYVFGDNENEKTGQLIAGLVALGGAQPAVRTGLPGLRVDLLQGANGELVSVAVNDRDEVCEALVDLDGYGKGKTKAVNAIDGKICTLREDDDKCLWPLEIGRRTTVSIRCSSA